MRNALHDAPLHISTRLPAFPPMMTSLAGVSAMAVTGPTPLPAPSAANVDVPSNEATCAAATPLMAVKSPPT